jgi:hypothetical protein
MKRVTLYLDETLWHRWQLAFLQRQPPPIRKTSASKEVERLLRQQLTQWEDDATRERLERTHTSPKETPHD